MSGQARGMKTTELIRPPRAPSAPESSPFGPPVVYLAGPWLLLALALAGPFALVFTFVVVLVAATLLVLLAGTIVASPYLLVRHLRRRRTGHVSVSRPALQLVPAHIQRARS